MSQNILKQYKNKGDIEVGLDEAGRGCLFGPVCIAGVIWPKVDPDPDIVIKDSKKGPKLTWVKIGSADLSYVEIISGLDINEKVFILPSKSLFDYQKRFKERVQASFSFG